ncbi:MAG: 1-(5-phosphoribosyl)-5-[(5-phosphoribosylamino)methylideneamino]imidazole-4-carboxamide isomerase [Pseudohongiellaceae bacterium]
MLVIPAIDLKDGQCVRLRQGRMEEATVFSDDPVQMAGIWKDKGARRLHLVDLNGAIAGALVNAEIVTAIAEAHPELPIQIGGGIRNLQNIEFYLKAGVANIIIGTQAVRDPGFVKEACKAFPGKIMVGIDSISGGAGTDDGVNDKVATDGWTKVSEHSAISLAEKFGGYGVEAIIYTDITRDGMLKGVNVDATVRLAQHSPVPVIASGGISKLADIAAIQEAALKIDTTTTATGVGIIMGVIVGRALYEGVIDLTQAQQLADE